MANRTTTADRLAGSDDVGASRAIWAQPSPSSWSWLPPLSFSFALRLGALAPARRHTGIPLTCAASISPQSEGTPRPPQVAMQPSQELGFTVPLNLPTA